MTKPIGIDKAAKLKKIFDQTVLFMSEPEALAIGLIIKQTIDRMGNDET